MGRLGVPPGTIRRLVAEGRWLAVGRGVLVDEAFAHGARTDLRRALALLRPHAVASHGSAACLWGLTGTAPPAPAVTVPNGASALAAGRVAVEVHRTRRVPYPRSAGGFPVTAPARTLLDVAATTPADVLDAMIDRALGLGLVTVPSLQWAAVAGGRQPGGPHVRDALARRTPLDVPSQSALEAATNRLLTGLAEEHALPLPRREHRPQGLRYRLDYAWPEVRLGLEVDGYRWHGGPREMAADYERRNLLVSRRWRLLTFTWSQVVHRGDEVARRTLQTYRELAAGAG